ncbi:hypothetical protein PUMCH_004842 [Australozyma saopauloensis]|uniref:Mannosyltransferase n=1 Tax=Australozyma saopauloensis TaxID=291208 RepID=A0AAX4HGK6_9ASCO|nr:hypothetical protein PUMCH_004842 [[Candida] saopauloensis]
MFAGRRIGLFRILVLIVVLAGSALLLHRLEYIDHEMVTDSIRQFGYKNAEDKIKMPAGVRNTQDGLKIEYVEVADRQGTPQEIAHINFQRWKNVQQKKIHEPKDFNIEKIRPPADPATYDRELASIVSLVRNREMHALESSMREFEEKFNSKFLYPYTFLNEQPFSQKFKEKMRSLTKAEVNFVHIPNEVWRKPFDIDTLKEKEGIQSLLDDGVGYSDMESYHNMCRFYSGAFYKLPELQKYRYYMRMEPDVKFFTDINYDIFKYLSGTGKVYGFTVALYDSPQSVRTLFPETIKFLNEGNNSEYLHPRGAFQFTTESRQHPEIHKITGGYSTCHFWSNFEIADMDFFRGEAYSKYFEYLDSTGKFYYERWGDAPVHSLGLSLFADKLKIHWFQDIGYFHFPYYNCPNNEQTKGCNNGQFDEFNDLANQNCMGTWLHFETGVKDVY